MTDWNQIIRQGYTPSSCVDVDSLPDVVLAAVKTVAKHLGASTAVREHLDAVPKGPGTQCPDSPLDELAKYVEMQKGSIDKSDPHVNVAFIETFIMPVLTFEREAVLAAIEQCADATPFERVFTKHSVVLGGLYDQLWVAWFKAVAVPFKVLSEAEQQQYEAHIDGVLAPKYDYTVFNYDPETGISNRRTMAEAFPDLTASLVAELRELARVAEEADEAALATYFEALAAAHQCADIAQLEALWEAVDVTWVAIPPTQRLVPVHGMEDGYEHPVCVSPEWRLEVRTDLAAQAIAERRAGTIACARDLGLPDALVNNLEERLLQIDVGVFCSVVRAGVCANFRYAGQAVPNRQTVGGGKIFMDAANTERMTTVYHEVFERCAAPETLASCLSLITPETMLVHTITHEFAHPVGRTTESDAAMGSYLMKCLEEGKASLFGVLADDYRAKHDPDHRLELVTNTVVRLCRFMQRTRLEDTTVAPYINENRAAAHTLFETGVITLTAEGVVIDIERAKSDVWFDALRNFNRDVINAYQGLRIAPLQALTAKYCDVNDPRVLDLIDWVNRDD